jgi:hypothetical protein
MPLKIYYTKSWTPSQVFGVMSYARQYFQDLVSIKICVLSRERLSVGHPAESMDLGGDPIKHRKIFKGDEPMPPAKLWLIDKFIYQKGEEKSYGATPIWLTEKATIKGVAIVNLEDHISRNKTLNALECSKTVLHELGHVLGWDHYHCDKLKPNLMCTMGDHKIQPAFSVNEKMIKIARKSRFLLNHDS